MLMNLIPSRKASERGCESLFLARFAVRFGASGMATHWLKYNPPSKTVPRPSDPSARRLFAPLPNEPANPAERLRALLDAEGLVFFVAALMEHRVTSVEEFTLLVATDVHDIHKWSGSSKEQAQMLKTLLRQLATPSNVETARLKLGLRQILQAMTDHPSDEEAQEKGCADILELIPYSSDAEWRRVKSTDGLEKQRHLRALLSVPDCGTVKSVCRAAENHSHNLEIQFLACKLLDVLGRAPENLPRIAQSGGIEAAIGAIQAGAPRASLQVLGCHVLARLGLDAECYAVVPRKGGVVAVLGSMRVQRSVAHVQEAACLALHNLTWSTLPRPRSSYTFAAAAMMRCRELTLRVRGQAGGIEAVIAAMRGYPEHVGVQSEAIACLCSLAGTQEGGLKVKLGARGAIEAVVAGMKGHMGEVRVQEQVRISVAESLMPMPMPVQIGWNQPPITAGALTS